MEDLNEKCEQLIEECGTARVRDDTIQLQTDYALLVTNSQVCIHILFVLVPVVLHFNWLGSIINTKLSCSLSEIMLRFIYTLN